MPPLPTSPWSLFRSLAQHRDLILRLVGRETTQRFRGSVLGVAWAVLTPLLMAAVFTLVFTGIFPARWPRGEGGAFDFALLFLTGFAVYTFFSEAVGRAAGLVVGNPSYVTKVVFPLEVLPAVTVVSAMVNLGITLAIVAVGHLLLHGFLHWTAIFLPVVLLPFVVFLLGTVTLIAAAGVFIRDIGLVIGPVTSLLLFLSPVFFPPEAVPEGWRIVVRANPLTPIIEQSRTVLLGGGLPDFASLAIYLLLAFLVLAFAHWSFQRLRPGFADVL